MMPYLAPAQISSVEERLTGKNHSAMYFAGNAVATSIVGAISGNLVYEYIKNIFFARGKGFVWAEAADGLSASESAYKLLFGVEGTTEQVAASIFNFGNLIVPFVVSVTCVIGVFVALKLPRDFTAPILAKEFVAMDPSIDISVIESEEVKEERQEIIFVQVGLSVLSGFIFGFIWLGMLLKSLREFVPKLKTVIPYILSCFIPFASVYYSLKFRKLIIEEAERAGVKVSVSRVALVISSIILPIMPINIVGLAILQNGVNKLYAAKGL